MIFKAQKKYLCQGFSLLEVMVALAILALSFTSVFLVQARATKLAVDAKNITMATQLARLKLGECKKEIEPKIAAASDFNLEGNFEELVGYEKFTWECHAPKFTMTTPSASAIEKQLNLNSKDKPQNGMASSVAPSVISMVTNALGDSLRELAVIIRWKDDGLDQEVKVVTHITDVSSIAILAKSIMQGAQSMGGGKKSEDKENKEKGLGQ